MKKKYLALLLALALALTLFAGCGGASPASADSGPSVEEASAAEATEETAAAPEAAGDASAEEEVLEVPEEAAESAAEEQAEPEIDTSYLPEGYPMISDGSISLSIFQEFNPMMGLGVDSYGELPFWQEASRRTGIELDWNMISFASAEEQFDLLVAANDLPNIVPYSYYSGGVTNAVEDEIFVNLADYIEQYAPHYYQLVQRKYAHPIVFDQFGNAVAFYELADEQLPPNNGIFLRGDMMEEQGLEVPVTYDEYEEVLTKLKNAYDLEAPMYYSDMAKIALTGGKGVKDTFSLNADGEIIYGPITVNWREFLKVARTWYDKGLIYRDFYNVPAGQEIINIIQYMTSGKSAFNYGACDFTSNMTLSDPNGYLVPGHMPRDNRDDQVHLTSGVESLLRISWALGFNSTEEEIKAACLFMNYFYTDEGALYANFGVEGQSFEYDENGEPWFTDLVINNPDGLNQNQALVYYVGYFVPCHADYIKYNIATVTQYADFVEVWASADDAWTIPDMPLTQEEQDQYSAAAVDVETYRDEMLTKMIIGDADVFDDAVWQEYLDTMDSLGAGKMLEIYRAAYDRFQNG